MKRILLIFLVMQLTAVAQAQPSLVTTIAGTGTSGYSGDGGPAINAQIKYPSRTRIDRAGNVYFIQSSGNVVRKVDINGIITTVAGTGIAGYSGDGGPATSAMLRYPTDIALDTASNLYIADADNECIRKVDALTGIITTICGGGMGVGNSGDGGLAVNATLENLASLAVDVAGNIYIGCHQRVRRILPSGIISSICGGGNIPVSNTSVTGGPAWTASISTPVAMCADAHGNLYIALSYGTSVVYLVANNGYIYRFAGGYNNTSDGIHALNASVSVQDLAIDVAGRLFLSEGSHRVRMINADTIINTIAGTGVSGYSGDGGDALLAEFNWPAGIALDSCNNLYVADDFNSRIRKVAYATCNALSISNFKEEQTEISMHPNPATSIITITSPRTIKQATITDITGREVLRSTQSTIDMSGLTNGVYFVKVVDVNGGLQTGKILKE